jgi:hypothetical protein
MIKRYRVVRLLVICCLIMNICSYSIMAQDIVINGGVVNHTVYGNGTGPYGNKPLTPNPSNNTVTITNVRVLDCVFGGMSEKGIVEGNKVEMRGGAIYRIAYGGWGDGDVIKNRLKILDGTIGGDAYGGSSFNNGRVERNVLEMTGRTIGGDAYGGWVWGNGEAIENTLVITKGDIGGVAYGGR